MVFQVAAVLWSIIGYSSHSTLLFSAGAALCITLNIIQLFSGQTNPLVSIAIYSVSIAFSGYLSGILIAGIILCTISIVKPRFIHIYPPTTKQT